MVPHRAADKGNKKRAEAMLTELRPGDIQDFYAFRLETVKATTVIHDHAVNHRALKYAVKMDMIPVNPADKVEHPRKEAFQASFYDRSELNRLFEAVRTERLSGLHRLHLRR